MYAGVILTLLATSTPIETTVKYDLTYRPARPSDFSTRMYKDLRVTYLPDYSVRVRTGGKTIWLKRQGDIGLIRDVTIARDGSIQYNHDRFFESDSYIWHRGVATKLVHEEFDNALIGGYQDRENYYFTAIKDLGPKGRWNTGPELFQVKNGVKSYIGPGFFEADLGSKGVLANAMLGQDGLAAGLDLAVRGELRLYQAGKHESFSGGEFHGEFEPAGAVITTHDRTIRIGWVQAGRTTRWSVPPGQPLFTNRRGDVFAMSLDEGTKNMWIVTPTERAKIVVKIPRVLEPLVTIQPHEGALSSSRVVTMLQEGRDKKMYLVTLSPK